MKIHDLISDEDTYPWPEEGDGSFLDETLVAIVDGINGLAGEVEWPITMLVDGALLSGSLIPAWRWFELQAGPVGGQDGVGVRNFLREVGEEHRSTAKIRASTRDVPEEHWTQEQHEAEAYADPHLHLKDATLPTAAGTPPLLWRVRLDRVGAWSLGSPSPQGS